MKGKQVLHKHELIDCIQSKVCKNDIQLFFFVCLVFYVYYDPHSVLSAYTTLCF